MMGEVNTDGSHVSCQDAYIINEGNLRFLKDHA